jgi:hypothetical protein
VLGSPGFRYSSENIARAELWSTPESHGRPYRFANLDPWRQHTSENRYRSRKCLENGIDYGTGSLEIFPKEDLIGEGSQIFFEAVEMRWFSNPRKKFLPDRSDQPSAILTNQLTEDRCQPSIELTPALLASPQGQRPNVGVDQDRQLRLPSSLRFVVVARIKIDGAEKRKNLEALALTNVFGKSRRDGLLLGLVMSNAPGLFDQFVIQG